MLIVMAFQAFSIGPVCTGRCSSDSETDDGNAAVIFEFDVVTAHR